MAGRVLALILGWLVLTLAAPGALAQTATPAAPAATAPSPSAAAASAAAKLDHAQSDLRALWREARKPGLDNDAVSKLQSALAPVQAEIHAAVDPLKATLADVDERLAALGPAPKPGAPPEAGTIAHDRRTLTGLHVALDAQIKRGDLLLVEADQLGEVLAGLRVDSFSRRVGMRSQSVLSPGFWAAAAAELPDDLGRWAGMVTAEAKVAAAEASPRAALLAVLALAFALGLAWPLRVLLERLSLRLAVVRTSPERLRKAELAAGDVVIRSALPILGGVVAVWALTGLGLLSRQMVEVGWGVVRAVGFLAVTSSLGRAVLAPNRPALRLVPLADETARALSPYPPLLGMAAAIGIVLLTVCKVAGVSLAASEFAQAVVAVLHLVALALALSAMGRSRAAELAARAQERGRPEPGRGIWTLVLLSAWLALAAGVIALLLGYIAFALFVTREMVWVAVVGSALFVLVSLSDAFFGELAAEEGRIGRFAAHGMGIGSRTLDQMSVLLTGAARLMLWLLAWAAVLTPFGAGGGDALSHLQAGASSFHLGGVTVSPAAIAASIGLFIVGMFVTRMFRRWLETQYLPRTQMDVGLSATVATGVSYVGGVLALIVASAYLGLKLTQVTLIASALTVGVGFGLQSVIQNFVAGLILLAGRPIRVGDWIAVGGQEGDVQRINVRATEIKLFDGSVLILPNQELVTKPVRNVTWGSPLGQVVVVFTVGYETDLDQVSAIFLEAMKATKGILKSPAPGVAVTDFHDLGAVLRGVAYVASPRSVYGAKSEVLLEIGRRLRAAGVRPGVEVRQAVVTAGTVKPANAAEG